MTSAEVRVIDGKDSCIQSNPASKMDTLFDAVETNDVSIVKSFTKDELQRLCQVRHLFASEWSAPYPEYQTAYQRACLLGRTDIVRCMLDADIEVDQCFPTGNYTSTMRGAFLFACQSRSMPTILTLLNAGAPVDRLGSCTIAYADIFLPNIRLTRLLVDRPVSWENIYPIHFAIVDNNLDLLQKLLTSDTNKLLTTHWFSPLHIACLLNRSITMIDLLLAHENAHDVIVAKAGNNRFADQLATDQVIVNYLRPTRLSICEALEKKRQQDHANQLKSLEQGTSFQIFIKTLTGKTISTIVARDDTIDVLKREIEDKIGIPFREQRLVYGGKELRDVLTIGDYDISKEATLTVVVNLRGG